MAAGITAIRSSASAVSSASEQGPGSQAPSARRGQLQRRPGHQAQDADQQQKENRRRSPCRCPSGAGSPSSVALIHTGVILWCRGCSLIADRGSASAGLPDQRSIGEGVAQGQGLVAVRPGGDDRRSARRQAPRSWPDSPAPDAAARPGPAPTVDSLQPGISMNRGLQRARSSASTGGASSSCAVELIGGADAQRLHAVEHVELGDAQPGDAVDGERAPQRHHVEPAAAALATGGGTELMPLGAEAVAIGVEQLGRERAAADACGVGLDDAEDVVQVAAARRRCRSRRPPRWWWRRSHRDRCRDRYRAGTLGALRTGCCALAAQQIQQQPDDVSHHRRDLLALGQCAHRAWPNIDRLGLEIVLQR
jgi:hypothetical protein